MKQNNAPDTCREYLGIAKGYCPKEPKGTRDGRGFCGRHLLERGGPR